MIHHPYDKVSELNLDKSEQICIANGKTKINFLPTGDIFDIKSGHIMYNQSLGNNVFGAVSNIYLRVYKNGKVAAVVPLRGLASTSQMNVSENGIVWSGNAEGIEYSLKFILANENTWFWQVTTGDNKKEFDLLYVQDIGLASAGGLLNNELYMSQYVDQKIFETKTGYAVACRQNQNHGGHPYIYQGALDTSIVGFATDLSQIYGTSYRVTDVPVLLYSNLPNLKYQFEQSCTALQTKMLTGKAEVAFFAKIAGNLETAITNPENLDEISAIYKTSCKASSKEQKRTTLKLKPEFMSAFASEPLNSKELNELFPTRRHEETKDNKLLSFFKDDHIHVVLQEKEVQQERPHGHIITTALRLGDEPKNLLTSTNYMYGIFGCQTVCGNTSSNKFTSQARGLYNIIKNSGTRILVKIDGAYKILTMPAAYELGLNFAKWYYKINGDMLVVKLFTAADCPKMQLRVKSKKGIKYDFIVTTQLVLGGGEFESTVGVKSDGKTLLYTPVNAAAKNIYPELKYALTPSVDCTAGGDEIFFTDAKARDNTLLTLQIPSVSEFDIVTDATTEGFSKDHVIGSTIKMCEEHAKYLDIYKNIINDFRLEGSKSADAQKLNDIVYWYAHNAMVHYAVPHGLEQCGGAAWGTRDVCQGPLEFFLTGGHYDAARKTLLTVYSYQLEELREWPQWFMFDRYPYAADDCHGDVVFWPLKALADYIAASGDYSILDEKVPFKKHGGWSEKVTVTEHAKIAVETIYERFIRDTGLITYAGGDWDDTLQPINSQLAKTLISSWTVALAYQTLSSLSKAYTQKDAKFSEELAQKAKLIRDSFNKYLIKDGVVAGFGIDVDGEIKMMLHPDDTKSGIHYRLLPMTRSIIAELVTPEQAVKNMELIEKHLLCPDGARLMDAPARYEGGVSKMFARAEQASNVGREISLQYVHAHIRYIEALAKMGRSEQAWHAFSVINPINIKDNVKNAALRQSNAYFSSSEGAFTDRYDYAANFSKLRDGSIDVRAGWRIYSSGPGILMARIVSNLLGYKPQANGIAFDPVVTKEHDGMTFNTVCQNGQPLKITYKVKGKPENGYYAPQSIKINGTKVETTRLSNPYRTGGLLVSAKTLSQTMDANGENAIEIEL